MLCMLPFAFLSLAQTPTAGEGLLRDIFSEMAQIRNAFIEIHVSNRRDQYHVLSPRDSLLVWYESPTRFRVQDCGVFGDNQLFVSDGAQLLQDPLDDTGTSILRQAPKNVFEGGRDLALNGGAGAMFYYLLAGKAGFEKIVDTSSPITPANGGEPRVTFASKEAGTVNLSYTGARGHRRVTRIEYDDKPFFEGQGGRFGGRGGSTEGSLVVEEVSYLGEGQKLGSWVFSTAPHKNSAVQDLRKKKPAQG
jgi:hypothetical protein